MVYWLLYIGHHVLLLTHFTEHASHPSVKPFYTEALLFEAICEIEAVLWVPGWPSGQRRQT